MLYRPMQLLTQAQWWSCLAMHLHGHSIPLGQAGITVVTPCILMRWHCGRLQYQSAREGACRRWIAPAQGTLIGASKAEPRLWVGRRTAGGAQEGEACPVCWQSTRALVLAPCVALPDSHAGSKAAQAVLCWASASALWF